MELGAAERRFHERVEASKAAASSTVEDVRRSLQEEHSRLQHRLTEGAPRLETAALRLVVRFYCNAVVVLQSSKEAHLRLLLSNQPGY